MLGVKVNTSARSGPAIPLRASSSQFFVVGVFERGPDNDQVVLRSKADIGLYLGNRSAYSTAYDQLVAFFDEGGTQARVARVVGPAASTGNLTIMDSGGKATLTVNAASPGQWSQNISVKVVSTGEDSFRIEVYYNGNLVETQSGLSNPADVPSRFNSSPYIRVLNAGSTSVFPANIPVPNESPTSLSTGDDDRASIVASTYIAGLERFAYEQGDGCVSIPGQYGQDVAKAIADHCRENNRIAILAAPRGESKAELIARANNFAGSGEYAGLFAPWVVVGDGATGTRAISPEGYVAGVRARAHANTGPWRIPAGSIATAAASLNVDQTFTIGDHEELDTAGVSIIRRPSAAAGVRLYGWRSLSKDRAYKHLKTRDLLNYLTINAERVLEDFVFMNIDSSAHLASQVAAALTGLVEPISRAGGLYARVDEEGVQIDPGYYIEVGETINTIETMNRDELHAILYVRDTANASLISINIVKVGVAESF